MNNKRLATKASIVPTVGGQRYFSDADNGVRTHGFLLTVSGTLTVAATAAHILRNRGSILAALAKVGIRMDGGNRVILDTRSCRALQEIMTGRQGRAVRLTQTQADTAGAYNLTESLIVPASVFGTVIPSETALTEENVHAPVQVFAELAPVAVSRITNEAAATLTNLTVEVTQLEDVSRSDRPLFRPSTRELVIAVPAAADFEVSLRGSKHIAAVLLQQDSDEGERTDIIQTIQLLGDAGQSIIEQPTDFEHYVNGTSPFDGGVPLPGYAYGLVNFVADGRLSKVLNPLAVNNPRIIVGAVTGAGTNPRIRATIWELERWPGLTAPQLPFTE